MRLIGIVVIVVVLVVGFRAVQDTSRVVAIPAGGGAPGSGGPVLPPLPTPTEAVLIVRDAEDAPQDAGAASGLLNTARSNLSPVAANGRIVGWVVRGAARTIPAGVCVDWPPSSGSLRGAVAWTLRKGPDWNRTLLIGPGSFSGFQATLYWTPCTG